MQESADNHPGGDRDEDCNEMHGRRWPEQEHRDDRDDHDAGPLPIRATTHAASEQEPVPGHDHTEHEQHARQLRHTRDLGDDRDRQQGEETVQ